MLTVFGGTGIAEESHLFIEVVMDEWMDGWEG
jgi:hypothetical protein